MGYLYFEGSQTFHSAGAQSTAKFLLAIGSQGLSHRVCTAAAFQVKYCSSFATAVCSVSVPDSQST